MLYISGIHESPTVGTRPYKISCLHKENTDEREFL